MLSVKACRRMTLPALISRQDQFSTSAHIVRISTMVSLNGFRSFTEVFSDDGKIKRRYIHPYAKFLRNMDNVWFRTRERVKPTRQGIIYAEGMHWEHVSRFCREILHTMAFEPEVTGTVTNFLAEFIIKLGKCPKKPVRFSYMKNNLNGFVSILCSHIILGSNYAKSADNLNHLKKVLSLPDVLTYATGSRISKSARFPFNLFCRKSNIRKAFQAVCRDLDGYVKTFCQSSDAESWTFVASYFDHMETIRTFTGDCSEKLIFTEDELPVLLLDLLIGSCVPLSKVIGECVSHLARHPHVQEQLRKECTENNFWNQLPHVLSCGFAQIANEFPYVTAVLCEVLRLTDAILPTGICRKATGDHYINQHRISKNCPVIGNIRFVHWDPTFWEFPEAFIPERFIVKGQLKIPPNLVPFSLGPRSCPGGYFTCTIALATIAALAENFSFSWTDTLSRELGCISESPSLDDGFLTVVPITSAKVLGSYVDNCSIDSTYL